MNWQLRLKALRTVISLALLLSVVSVGCAQVNADISPTQDHTSPTRETPLNAPELSDLLARAQASGKVRVIVGLQVPFKPEGELASQQAISDQRARIARVQADLLTQLSAHKVTDVKTVDFIPYMAMTVDMAALQYLASSPNVTSITEDKLASSVGSH